MVVGIDPDMATAPIFYSWGIDLTLVPLTLLFVFLLLMPSLFNKLNSLPWAEAVGETVDFVK